MIYYPKYHCKLNNIKYFWYSAKKWFCEYCNYILDDLQQFVPCTLASVSNHNIFAYFYKYRQKMDLYHENIRYRSLKYKACTAYHKPTNKSNTQ